MSRRLEHLPHFLHAIGGVVGLPSSGAAGFYDWDVYITITVYMYTFIYTQEEREAKRLDVAKHWNGVMHVLCGSKWKKQTNDIAIQKQGRSLHGLARLDPALMQATALGEFKIKPQSQSYNLGKRPMPLRQTNKKGRWMDLERIPRPIN